jgi:hypothetical protein
MALDGQNAQPYTAARGLDSFRRVAFAIVALVMLLNLSALQSELRFFMPSPVMNVDGSAPVLQDSRRSPAADRAFRLAAASLPTNATCVISVDAWNEDYFRASYLMMPRRVWPYSTTLEHTAARSRDLTVALRAHDTSCLLLGAGVEPPPHATRITSGSYSVFMVPRDRRQ